MFDKILIAATIFFALSAKSHAGGLVEENEVFLMHPENSFHDIGGPNDELDVAQSVVDQFKLWESGQDIRFCFFDGCQVTRMIARRVNLREKCCGCWQIQTLPTTAYRKRENH